MVESVIAKPLNWLLGILISLVVYIWKKQEGHVKENKSQIQELEDLLKEKHYTKEEVNERLGFAVEPVHAAVNKMAEALKENTTTLHSMHTDLQVLKVRTDAQKDAGN